MDAHWYAFDSSLALKHFSHHTLGDKVETATTIAVSSKLVARNTPIFTFDIPPPPEDAPSGYLVKEAQKQLFKFGKMKDAALVIDGNNLQLCLDNHKSLFVEVSCKAPAVVCCRCSPTQKVCTHVMLMDTLHCDDNMGVGTNGMPSCCRLIL